MIVPAGIALAVRLIPPDVMSDLRKQADERVARPRSLSGAMVIIFVWTSCLATLGFWTLRHLR